MQSNQPILLEFIEKMERLGRFQDEVDAPAGIEQIWRVFLSNVRNLIQSSVCALFLVDGESREFCMRQVEPEDQRECCEKEARLQIECGMFAWVIHRRTPAIIPSLVFKNKQTLIMLPLTTARSTLGSAMVVTPIEGEAITQENLKLLGMLARECSLVMENTLLYQQLKHEHDSLLEAQDRIIQSEKLAAVGRLTSGACHEILNPLNILSGYMQLIQLECGSEVNQTKYLHNMLEQTGRIDRIVKGLLKFSRPHRGKADSVQLNCLIETVLEAVNADEGRSAVRIHKHLDRNLPCIKGNTEELSEALAVVTTNALEAMPQGGELNISSELDCNGEGAASGAADVVVRIEDSGHGIADEAIGNIFEPFFTTKADEGRIGLGLSLCYGIIHEHGGRIEISSQVGRGTNVTIQLPTDRVGESLS